MVTINFLQILPLKESPIVEVSVEQYAEQSLSREEAADWTVLFRYRV